MDLGDPNLWFEGVGAAIVGGVVAALTAVVVVNRTNAGMLRHAQEAEARAQALRVLMLGKEISVLTNELMGRLKWVGRASGRRREEAVREFEVAAFTLEALLQPVNSELANRLRTMSMEDGPLDHAWVRRIVSLVAAVYSPNLRLVPTGSDGASELEKHAP